MEDRGRSMTTASKIKKINKLPLLFCLAALLTVSCAMTPKAKIIYDESIVVEKTAWICPTNIGAIIGYNGMEVNWKFNPFSFSTFIQIPAGNTLLEWNIDSSQGNMIYRADNILMRYNFLPGKQYLFLLGRDPSNENGNLGLKVYMYNIGERIGATYSEMDKHYQGFAPFLNVDNRRTILE
jgi:hypothetical protein